MIEERDFTIQGPADHGITLDGDGVTGLFFIFDGSSLTLRNLTLTGTRSVTGAVTSGGPSGSRTAR